MEQQQVSTLPRGGVFANLVTNYVTKGVIRVWIQDADKVTHQFVAISEVDDTEEEADKVVAYLAEAAKAKAKGVYVTTVDDFTKYIRVDGLAQTIWINKGLCKMTQHEADTALRVKDILDKL